MANRLNISSQQKHCKSFRISDECIPVCNSNEMATRKQTCTGEEGGMEKPFLVLTICFKPFLVLT